MRKPNARTAISARCATRADVASARKASIHILHPGWVRLSHTVSIWSGKEKERRLEWIIQ